MTRWLIAVVGGGICIAVLAAALAPSPGNHVQPIGGVLGFAGLFVSLWIAWYAHYVPTSGSTAAMGRHRIRQRVKARRILDRDPRLANELRIGRPDPPRTYDDGGLVDVNAVEARWLATVPGVDLELAQRIVAVRHEIGSFDSVADLEGLLEIPPATLDRCRDLLVAVIPIEG